MATQQERLQALERKQAQIKAQIEAIKARAAARERKLDTRRKILIGGVVLGMIKDGKLPQSQLDAWLDEALTQDRDRALFGLAAKPALSPTGEAGGGV